MSTQGVGSYIVHFRVLLPSWPGGPLLREFHCGNERAEITLEIATDGSLQVSFFCRLGQCPKIRGPLQEILVWVQKVHFDT